MLDFGLRKKNNQTKMKKLALIFLVFTSLFLNSCGGSDENSQNSTNFNDSGLITVGSEGNVFSLNSNTGEKKDIGHITTQSNLIQLATLCLINSNIYAVEATYVPSPNILIVYNQTTNTTNTHQIILPSTVTSIMVDPFITNMEYNGSEFIAVVSENMPNSTRPNKIITINPVNFQTTDLQIDFFQRSLTSTELINDKLYISTRTEGLLEIDLTQKTLTELFDNGSKINATRLAKSDNSLALMRFGVTGIKPFMYDLTNNVIYDISLGNNFNVANPTGGTIYLGSEYINLAYNTSGELGILTIDALNSEVEFEVLNHSDLSPNSIIIGSFAIF